MATESTGSFVAVAELRVAIVLVGGLGHDLLVAISFSLSLSLLTAHVVNLVVGVFGLR